MDAATAVIIGAIIGASASLLAGTIVPLIAEAVRRRFEANRARIKAVKEIVPRGSGIGQQNYPAPRPG